MRPVDLPSVAELAKKNPHGRFIKYLAGCRCWRCVKCEADYMVELERRHRTEGRNNLVPVDRVRAFLLEMQKRGIGYMTIARHVGVGKTKLGELLWPPRVGAPQWIRAQKERKVLSYVPTLDTIPRRALVPAGDTVTKLRQLLEWGITKTDIGHDGFGVKNPFQVHALEGKGTTVKASVAIRVRDYYAKIEKIRSIWLSAHGSIPPRHYVYWKRRKNGRHDFLLKHLELRTFAVGWDYHYRYSAELKAVIKLKNKIQKAYRKVNRDKNQKHDAGPAGPSVPSAGGTRGRRQAA
jgi:hypothetical protein